MTKAFNIITALQGKSLVTAESITGGAVGAILTCIPGSSQVFKGGVIAYTNEVKRGMLNVSKQDLEASGAVSEPVARQMALGARRALHADIAVAVTGVAGPTGDDHGHEIGTVFIGYADAASTRVREYHFEGDREAVRDQTIEAALDMILENA